MALTDSHFQCVFLEVEANLLLDEDTRCDDDDDDEGVKCKARKTRSSGFSLSLSLSLSLSWRCQLNNYPLTSFLLLTERRQLPSLEHGIVCLNREKKNRREREKAGSAARLFTASKASAGVMLCGE